MAAAKPELVALVNTVVDAAVDTANAVKPGQTASQRIADYENLVTDAIADVQGISDIGAEVQALGWQDYLDLAAAAGQRLGLTSAKAQAVLTAVLTLLQDVKTGNVIPDVLAVVAAVRG